MLGSKSSNKKTKRPDQSFTTKEKVDWSSTEGYETMKEVNNFLKWPSVWVNRQDKTSREINIHPAKSGQKPKVEVNVDNAISKPRVDKPSSKAIPSKSIKGSDLNIKKTEVPSLSKSKKEQHPEVNTSKVSQNKNHFWQFLVKGWSARKLKKLNQERSRQIKRLSVSGTLSDSQIDSTTFQTKEGQRRQINKVISNKTVVQPSSGKVQPSQPASLPKIEENQEDFNNKNKDKQKEKEKEQKQEKISKPTPKMEAESQNKIEQQRFRDLQQRVEQKSWARPTITETNLIKGQTTLYFNWRRFWLDLIQWLVITLFFLSLCGVLFYLWRQNQNKQTTDTAQRLAKVDQLVTLAENEVGDVLDFRLRLMLVSELLNGHVYWGNFFSFLEKNTLPNVFYQDFSGDTHGEYILKARTDNFDSMAKQLKVLRRAADVLEVDSEGGDMVKNEPTVDESGTSSEATATPSTQLNFSIRLKIKPELFFR